MKHLIRAISLVLFLLMTLTSLSWTVVAEDTTDSGRIVGETVDIFLSSLGIKRGGASGHGNNQTRITATSTGVYISFPWDEFDDPAKGTQGTNYGLIRLNPDKSVDLLLQDVFYWVAAGTTTNVMVDKNEDIWTCTSWDDGEGFYQLVAWQYDVSEQKATKYEKRGYYRRGNMYGKPISIIDPDMNCIYQVALGGEKSPAHMIWATFDIGTKEWGDILYTKTDCSAYYHWGYGTGKGGFVMATERALQNQSAASDIEGMSVYQAIQTLRSRKQDANFMWDEAHLIYVPDATVAEAYNRAIYPAVYDVKNGVYPNITNFLNDAYLDKETGYFYNVITMDDNETAGIVTKLVVYDTEGFEGEIRDDTIFPIVATTDIRSLYGADIDFAQHFFKDLEGNLYLIINPTTPGIVEIWKATNNPATEFQLVYETWLDGDLDGHRLKEMYATIIASNRNNTPASDTAHLMYWDTDHGWYYYSVDFAALREYLKAE